MTAAGYVRLSLETDTTTSPERQRAHILELAQRHSLEPVVWFQDDDTSAYSGADRPAFDEMMARLDEWDAVLVWAQSRLSRRTEGIDAVIAQCVRHGVRVITAEEGERDLHSPEGVFLTKLQGNLDEFESRRIGRRVLDAQRHIVRQGRFRGGHVPYGWTVDDDGQLVVDPETGPVVRRIVDRMSQGTPAAQVARELNAQGIPPPRGHRWEHTSILYMVRHPRMVGQPIFEGEPVVDRDGAPVIAHEPMVEWDVWSRLLSMVGRQPSPRRRGRPGNTLLAGLAVCDRCDVTMRGWTASPGHYRCPECNQAISRVGTDDAITRLVKSRFDADAWAVALAAQTRPDPDAQIRARLTERLRRLEEDRLDGIYDGRRQEYRERHQELRDELAAIDRPPSVPTFDVVDPAREWDDMPLQRLRRFLAHVLVEVRVLPKEGDRRRFDAGRLRPVWRQLS